MGRHTLTPTPTPTLLPQIWFTLVVALLFLISQVAAQTTHDVGYLATVSGLLGMAYGNLFALLPIVVLEWFGLGAFAVDSWVDR